MIPHDGRPPISYYRSSIKARNSDIPGYGIADFRVFGVSPLRLPSTAQLWSSQEPCTGPKMTSMAFATSTSVGYAGKPLAEKLGYAPGATIAFVGLPEELADLPASVDFGKVARRQDWARPLGTTPFDIIHGFTTSRAELVAGLPRLRRAIQPNGMIWVSWPKQASKVPTDVTEDVIRAVALKHDLVDVKVAAIDQVWSGLKLVIRVDRR